MTRPSIAIIVTTYDQPDYLARVLRALSAQCHAPHEVIIADDGSGEATRRVFEHWAATQQFSTRHVWHEKQGFRRARILNAAIARAESEYIVFLDGDTIPHPKFAADHRALARRKCFIQGHRVLVSQKGSGSFGAGTFFSDRGKAVLAGQLNRFKYAFRWVVPFKRVMPNLDGVRGCNLSVWRWDLAAINGYNEDYVGWGCEDLDLAQRLMNSGIRRMDVRGRALGYHLWHPLADRSNLPANEKILRETKYERRIACERGLNEHLAETPREVWTLSATKKNLAAARPPPCVPVETIEFGR